MYLFDSVAGEVIEPGPHAYLNKVCVVDDEQNGDYLKKDLPRTNEVDFRYNGTCLMLLLDGHISTLSPWSNLADLQNNLRINITDPLSATPYTP